MKGDNDASKNAILGMYHLLAHLPSSISLPLNKAYVFTINGKTIHASLHNNKWPVAIIDHSNELLFDGKNVTLRYPTYDFSGFIPQVVTNNGEVMNVTEFLNNSFREFYPSPSAAVIIKFESYETSNNNEIAIEALRYFFKAYQIISEDIFALSQDELFSVTNTYFKYFYPYSVSEITMPESERYSLVFDKKFEGYQAQISAYRVKNRFIPDYEIENDKRLFLYLNSTVKNDFILEAITNAHRQLTLYKNYKYALLECFFVIEFVVFRFVEKKKIERGISKNKLKDFSNRIGISYLINIEMPLLLEIYDDLAKKILSELDQVRKVRNDIVHNAKSVSEMEARHAFKSTNDLLQYLQIEKF